LQKYNKAIDYYLKSLVIKPKAKDAMLNIAVIYLQNLKNCKESIRWAYKILNEDANHSRAKTILKRCGDI
jgi:tetratricopeptide (TPR) repeat protein